MTRKDSVEGDPRVDDLRAWMRRGRVDGTFLKLPSTAVVDIAAEAFDFAVVDREHSQLGQEDALAMLNHAYSIGFPAILRIPALDPPEVNRALEAGAAGIQLSRVEAAEQVRLLREACEYAPVGRRSVSLGHGVAGYGRDSMKDYIERSRGRPLVIAQLESVRTEDSYSRILEERPDVAFVGMADLTVESEFDRATLAECLDEIRAAARANEVILGGIDLGDDPQVLYSMVSSDVALLRQAMLDARDRAEPDPETEDEK